MRSIQSYQSPLFYCGKYAGRFYGGAEASLQILLLPPGTQKVEIFFTAIWNYYYYYWNVYIDWGFYAKFPLLVVKYRARDARAYSAFST